MSRGFDFAKNSEQLAQRARSCGEENVSRITSGKGTREERLARLEKRHQDLKAALEREDAVITL
ncbi:hypothetical protein [Marinobacterium mangrovicola]|uniref:Uncharacterized protein n=1 Tax=Marinobacterium mangrovicola TaxID=1476959 RepID=A0A4R1GLF3_9GAMM|nr:hypothetical protein [Marinobacterium mangrovicola]TCK09068.1 hypothetical protein CLV83_1169 [Marinobacterium mangrovicola]